MKASNFLSKADLEVISSAIKDAEKKTGGELVININTRSDDYHEAFWKSGVLFLFIFSCAAAVLFLYRPEIQWQYRMLTVAAGAAISFLLGSTAAVISPPFRRLIIGKNIMKYYTDLKAHEAFLHEEVFNTRKRTGILIYLSLFEKTAVILGDSGINAKVKDEEWQEIASSIASGIKERKKADAIARAVRMCGDLLEKHGVSREAGDIDELSNDVRIGK